MDVHGRIYLTAHHFLSLRKHTYLFPYVKITAFRVRVGWETLTASAGLSVYQVERVSMVMHPSDCQLYSGFRLPERWGHCRSDFISLHWQYTLFCFPNITLRLIPDAQLVQPHYSLMQAGFIRSDIQHTEHMHFYVDLLNLWPCVASICHCNLRYRTIYMMVRRLSLIDKPNLHKLCAVSMYCHHGSISTFPMRLNEEDLITCRQVCCKWQVHHDSPCLDMSHDMHNQSFLIINSCSDASQHQPVFHNIQGIFKSKQLCILYVAIYMFAIRRFCGCVCGIIWFA